MPNVIHFAKFTGRQVNSSAGTIAAASSLQQSLFRRGMSPTIFRERGYRFFFFSLEEARMHVHVRSASGEAKFWLEPAVVLAKNHQYSPTELRQIQEIIEARRNELAIAWNRHFGN